MKRYLTKITLFSLVAATLMLAPAASRAADSTDAPAAKAHAAKKHRGLPFHGKIAKLDSAAMTFTVGQRTFVVTSATKIIKDGKPAAFSDLTAGEKVGGSYKKADDGKLEVATLRIGEKLKKHARAAKKKDTAPAN